MSGMPFGLVVGPDDTFYGELRNVPLHGWEVRFRGDHDWTPRARMPNLPRSIVQARRVLAPPKGVELASSGRRQIATTWGEMRLRPDLVRWECANPGPSFPGWWPCDADGIGVGAHFDDFPLIVRRRT